MSKTKSNHLGGTVRVGIILVILIAIGLIFTQTRTRLSITATPKSTTPETPAPPPVASSGIKGQILYGSSTDCYSTDPNSQCNKPRTATGTVIIKHDNGIVAKVTSNSSGYFIVKLTPGTYTVSLEPKPDGQLSGTSNIVKVEPGKYAETSLFKF